MSRALALDLLLRFVVGGVLVSLFAVLGQLWKPAAFGGIFGAAPSVALASLGLLVWKQGAHAASVEGHAMLFGALALTAYAVVAHSVIRRKALPTWAEAGLAWVVWLGIALPAWAWGLR